MNETMQRSTLGKAGNDLTVFAIGGVLMLAFLMAALTALYSIVRYMIEQTREAARVLGPDALAVFCLFGIVLVACVIAAVILIARFVTRTERRVSEKREDMLRDVFEMVTDTNRRLMAAIPTLREIAPPEPEAPRLVASASDIRLIDGKPVERSVGPVLYRLSDGRRARVDLMEAIVDALHSETDEQRAGEDQRDYVRRVSGLSFTNTEYGPAVDALLQERFLTREGGRIAWQMEREDMAYRLSRLKASAGTGAA